MPRIIAGRFKGLKLAAPPGRKTRPTADRVKESIFSILESLPFDLKGARVIDFFAGSGALGLEALSRGASSALVADMDRGALAVIRKNISALGPDGRAEVLAVRWPQGLTRLRGGPAFDLFLLDPPYDQFELPLSILKAGAELSLVAPKAEAVWEQAPENIKKLAAADLKPWKVIKGRSWGGQAAAFLIYDP